MVWPVAAAVEATRPWAPRPRTTDRAQQVGAPGEEKFPNRNKDWECVNLLDSHFFSAQSLASFYCLFYPRNRPGLAAPMRQREVLVGKPVGAPQEAWTTILDDPPTLFIFWKLVSKVLPVFEHNILLNDTIRIPQGVRTYQ